MSVSSESILDPNDRSRAGRQLAVALQGIDALEVFGRVMAVRGLLVEIAGPVSAMSIGGAISIETSPGRFVGCEIVGFEGGRALAMPFAGLDGVRRGCRALVQSGRPGVRPNAAGSAVC